MSRVSLGLGVHLSPRAARLGIVVSDVTAPTLTSPTSAQTGTTTATLGVTTNEANGTLYWFVSASASPPTATALKAGTGAVASGTQAITTTGAKTVSVTGLTASTLYYGYLLHRDAAGNDSVISSTASFTTAALSTLSISTAPTISGDPIVGQRLYATNGTYNVTPDSYAGQWYAAGSAINGETGDNYLVQDADVGSVLAYKEIAAKSGYTSSSLNPSANTAAVTDISLTGAITALTRTSSSGVTPMTFSIAFASNVYTGYILRVRVYSDSGLSTLLQDVVHTLTSADIAGGALDLASDGLTAIGATDWMQVGIQTTSPNGNPYSYSFGTTISPTDAVAAMTWSTTDKNSDITLSGGNLIASGGGGSRGQGIRGSRALTGKSYFEVSVSGPQCNDIGIADASAPLDSLWWSVPQEGLPTTHAGCYDRFGNTWYNGVNPTTGGADWGGGPAIAGCAYDATAKKAWFSYNGTWQNGDPAAGTGGLSVSSISSPVYAAMQFSFGGTGTANFGATAFNSTPPTGFTAP